MQRRRPIVASPCARQLRRSSPARHVFRAFTLIELLVVVAVLALLISILLPALAGARDQARFVVCGTNLSGFGRALLLYGNDNNDAIPRGIWLRTQNENDPVLGEKAREFYWELLWDYLDLPDAPTYQDKLNAVPDAGVLWCPSLRLPPKDSPEWRKARSYAINEGFQTTQRDRFNRIVYPQTIARATHIRRPALTAYIADNAVDETSDSHLSRLDLAEMFSPPPDRVGDRTVITPKPRHRNGRACNVAFLDSHVEATTLAALPRFDLPLKEDEYYEAHVFWSGKFSSLELE